MASRHSRITCPVCGTSMLATSKRCRTCYNREREMAAADGLRERFYRHVDKSGECWIWTAAKDKRDGYGRMTVHGEVLIAPRVAYTLEVGPIPPGRNVLHRCDNPPCVRHDHLFLGSHADNRQDCQSKGRWHRKNLENVAKGERNNKAHLTEEAVREIRREIAAGVTQQVLAEKYGVKQVTISDIKTGRTWKHVI